MDSKQALVNALKELVYLHQDWDKGTAYVTVKFMHMNNDAIAAARAAIVTAESEIAERAFLDGKV